MTDSSGVFDGGADDSAGDGFDAGDGHSRHVAAEEEVAEGHGGGGAAAFAAANGGCASGGMFSFELGGRLEELNEGLAEAAIGFDGEGDEVVTGVLRRLLVFVILLAMCGADGGPGLFVRKVEGPRRVGCGAGHEVADGDVCEGRGDAGVKAIDAEVEAEVGVAAVAVGSWGKEASDFRDSWAPGLDGDVTDCVPDVVVERVSAAAGVAVGEGEDVVEHGLRRERGVRCGAAMHVLAVVEGDEEGGDGEVKLEADRGVDLRGGELEVGLDGGDAVPCRGAGPAEGEHRRGDVVTTASEGAGVDAPELALMGEGRESVLRALVCELEAVGLGRLGEGAKE